MINRLYSDYWSINDTKLPNRTPNRLCELNARGLVQSVMKPNFFDAEKSDKSSPKLLMFKLPDKLMMRLVCREREKQTAHLYKPNIRWCPERNSGTFSPFPSSGSQSTSVMKSVSASFSNGCDH